MKDILAGLLRHVLTIVGGGLATRGVIDSEQLTSVIGAVITIFGVVWSVVEKRNRALAAAKEPSAPPTPPAP